MELGGWDALFAFGNPPPHLLEREIAPFPAWLIWHLLISPRLELFEASASPLGDHTYRVRLAVQNTGWLPTYVTKQALEKKLVQGLRCEIALPPGATLETGKAREERGQLEGRAYKPSTPTRRAADNTDERVEGGVGGAGPQRGPGLPHRPPRAGRDGAGGGHPVSPQAPEVQTTVVGSYPTPEWLRAYPSRDHLRDATLVVVRAQELAGIDVVSDGELSRFDVNHPETNGMIDYFVGQLDGVRTRLSAADTAAFSRQEGMAFRAAPAGAVAGPLGPGTLDLPAAARPLRQIAQGRTKYTLTSPYMLAKSLLDRHYGDRHALTLSLAAVLREQVREHRRGRDPGGRGQPPRPPPGRAPRRGGRSTPSWKGCPGEGSGPCTSASATTAGKWCRRATMSRWWTS